MHTLTKTIVLSLEASSFAELAFFLPNLCYNKKMEVDKLFLDKFENKLIQFETKLAYIEDFVNQLQEITLQQTQTIDTLQCENKNIAQKMAELAKQFEEDIPNQRPPHY
ncbi:MAG TPA: SlyX family protein [Treponemataceae bacterium]|nr:SlyX family protein [Treponemataceae bacterium]